jgi:hypothetical protein
VLIANAAVGSPSSSGWSSWTPAARMSALVGSPPASNNCQAKTSTWPATGEVLRVVKNTDSDSRKRMTGLGVVDSADTPRTTATYGTRSADTPGCSPSGVSRTFPDTVWRSGGTAVASTPRRTCTVREL